MAREISGVSGIETDRIRRKTETRTRSSKKVDDHPDGKGEIVKRSWNGIGTVSP